MRTLDQVSNQFADRHVDNGTVLVPIGGAAAEFQPTNVDSDLQLAGLNKAAAEVLLMLMMTFANWPVAPEQCNHVFEFRSRSDSYSWPVQ
jgi:hypothetical protein